MEGSEAGVSGSLLQTHNTTEEQLNGHPKYKEILDRMWELHDSKARSYGSSEDPLANLRNGERFGMPAWKRCIVEADSAFYRLQNYCNGRNDSLESAMNALEDTAAFCMLAILFLEEQEESVKVDKCSGFVTGEFIPKGSSEEEQSCYEVLSGFTAPPQKPFTGELPQNSNVPDCAKLLHETWKEPSPPKSNGVAMADVLFTGVFGMKRVDPGYRKPSEEVGKRIAEVLEKAT